MKIIKNNYKETTWKVKCPQCSSELEVNESDIQRDRDGRYFVCPCCGNFVGANLLCSGKAQRNKTENNISTLKFMD